VFSKRAAKYLTKLPTKSARRVVQTISLVATGKDNQNSASKLTGTLKWRLRVGDLRVIYEINRKDSVLRVLKIGPRGDVYK